MYYGYGRVSSRGQQAYGNSLQYQHNALIQAGVPEQNIYTEAFTGMKKSRPVLDTLLPKLQSGDTLVVTKLDRIARSTVAGCELVENLLNRGVTINILNMGVLDNSTTGKLIRTIFFAFAEFERDMIVQRTTEGREIAKANNPNYRQGRKPKRPENFWEVYDRTRLAQTDPQWLCWQDACAMLDMKKSAFYALAKKGRVEV